MNSCPGKCPHNLCPTGVCGCPEFWTPSYTPERTPSPAPPGPPQEACFFWYHGSCRRRNCQRPHRLCQGWTVTPPPGFVHFERCLLRFCPLREPGEGVGEMETGEGDRRKVKGEEAVDLGSSMDGAMSSDNQSEGDWSEEDEDGWSDWSDEDEASFASASEYGSTDVDAVKGTDAATSLPRLPIDFSASSTAPTPTPTPTTDDEGDSSPSSSSARIGLRKRMCKLSSSLPPSKSDRRHSAHETDGMSEPPPGHSHGAPPTLKDGTTERPFNPPTAPRADREATRTLRQASPPWWSKTGRAHQVLSGNPSNRGRGNGRGPVTKSNGGTWRGKKQNSYKYSKYHVSAYPPLSIIPRWKPRHFSSSFQVVEDHLDEVLGRSVEDHGEGQEGSVQPEIKLKKKVRKLGKQMNSHAKENTPSPSLASEIVATKDEIQTVVEKPRVLVDYELPEGDDRMDWDGDFLRRAFGEIE